MRPNQIPYEENRLSSREPLARDSSTVQCAEISILNYNTPTLNAMSPIIGDMAFYVGNTITHILESNVCAMVLARRSCRSRLGCEMYFSLW